MVLCAIVRCGGDHGKVGSAKHFHTPTLSTLLVTSLCDEFGRGSNLQTLKRLLASLPNIGGSFIIYLIHVLCY